MAAVATESINISFSPLSSPLPPNKIRFDIKKDGKDIDKWERDILKQNRINHIKEIDYEIFDIISTIHIGGNQTLLKAIQAIKRMVAVVSSRLNLVLNGLM